MNCDQCEMLSINGVPCHETGCPNSGKRYDVDSERWITQYECGTCGYTSDVDTECCTDDDEEAPRYRDADMMLMFSEDSGVYIPQRFARETFRECVSGVSDEDYAILEAGPDHEWYWEAWEAVCNNAVITSPETGKQYFVYQDGDCWFIEKDAEFNEDPSISEQNWVVRL